MPKGGDPSAYARQQEQLRQTRLTRGMRSINDTFAQFDPSFFQQRAQAYQSFAMPTLSGEFRDVSDKLAYDLANKGILNSSGARTLQNSLQNEMTRQKQGVVDTGIQQAQALQREVENQRSNIVAQLNASSNPAEAQAGALRAAASITNPSVFAPVGGFLENWARINLAKQYQNQVTQGNQSNNNVFLASTPVTAQG